MQRRSRRTGCSKVRLELCTPGPIFTNIHIVENNKGRDQNEIDLHGLRVKEAIERTDNAIVNARQNGLSELRLIVGKSLHIMKRYYH